MSRPATRSHAKEETTARRAGAVSLALALAIAACDERRADDPPAAAPLAVDLSGTWAGTWAGEAPEGFVTGTWEASIRQTASGVTGTVVLGGDVDCPDATVTGSVGEGNVLTGTLERAPCEPHSWTLTGLDLVERTMSGVWTQQPIRNASGTFTGRQVARPGGPHVAFLSPPAGPPGTLVTIVGRGFFPDFAATRIDFDGVPADAALVSLDTLVAVVPTTATSGRVAVTTPHGTAMSPLPFGATPSSPRPARNAVLAVESSPDGLVFGSEGRRVYVANRASGTVAMIDLRTNHLFQPTTPLDVWSTPGVQGVAASPDGRRIYVATGELGVTVLDTALNVVVDAIPLLAGEGLRGNPQGIAVSPDGRTLYVADDRDGGAFSVVDLATHEIVVALSRGPGSAPSAVAVSPDGARAYLAFTGADAIDVFDVESSATVAAVAVGPDPAGIAVSPDGRRVWVTSAGAGAVLEIDAEALGTAAVAVGTAPRGIAISPDGSRLYVANHGSGTVSVLGIDPLAVETTLASFCAGPGGVAVSPDGRRALVSCEGDGTIAEIGGPYTLTIAKSGTGYGQVTSDPAGIACGPACVARFDPGTVVTLAAIPDGSSRLESWSPGCEGGRVVMTENRHCIATFTYVTSNGSGPDAPVGHCFIATAAYGTELAHEVRALRSMRDRRLLGNAPGRAFVRAYYALSPPVARVIARHEGLRAAARAGLAPLAWAADRPDQALVAAVAVVLAALLPRRRPARSRREAP